MRPDNDDVMAIEEYGRKIVELEKRADIVRAERDRLRELKQRTLSAVYYHDDGDE